VLPIVGHFSQYSDSTNIQVEESCERQKRSQKRVEENAINFVVKRIHSKVGGNELDDVSTLSDDNSIETFRQMADAVQHGFAQMSAFQDGSGRHRV